MMKIETKVAASGGGAIAAAFVIWALGVAVWGAPADAAHAEAATAAVPSPVTGLILLGLTVGFGYWAPHTARLVEKAPPVDRSGDVGDSRRVLAEGQLVGGSTNPAATDADAALVDAAARAPMSGRGL